MPNLAENVLTAQLFFRSLTRTLLVNAINLVREHLEAFLSGFMEAMNSLYYPPLLIIFC